jgi:hypothetical protein
MNIIKLYSHKSQQQIWRILISESDKLIIETRDLTTKEVFFNCFFLESGEEIFSNLQLDEKCWIGIEGIYKEIIFFHFFPKPDMPHHKGIVAFDIASQRILWHNNDLSFLFTLKDKVYGYQQGFEERDFFSLDYLNGEILEELGTEYKVVNSLHAEADSEKNWSAYIYPKIFSEEEENLRGKKIIYAGIKDIDIEGAVEYNIYDDLLFYNYHLKTNDGKFDNKFFSCDLNSGKIILAEILNSKAQTLFADSFFVYKNFLFLLKEKNEVVIYKLE